MGKSAGPPWLVLKMALLYVPVGVGALPGTGVTEGVLVAVGGVDVVICLGVEGEGGGMVGSSGTGLGFDSTSRN